MSKGCVSWTRALVSLLLAFVVCNGTAFAQTSDPLPSWNDNTAKKAIVSFVVKVTKGGPGYVPLLERIAVFDNDGTLWSEQPMYAQMVFARSMFNKFWTKWGNEPTNTLCGYEPKGEKEK